MFWLVLQACNPWSALHEREQIWYDADRIENEQELDLIEIEAGEPIGYWPRIVVRSDRIEFDNRAWFLSLPEEFFLSDEHTDIDRRAYLVESQTVEILALGAMTPSNGQDVPFPQLARVFEEHANSVESFRERFALSEPNMHRTTVISEPDVPWGTAAGIMYTAMQSLVDLPVLAGRVGNRLRTPMASVSDEGLCLVEGRQRLTNDGAWLEIPGIPPLVGEDGCAGSDWASIMDAAETLLEGCHARWPGELPIIDLGALDALEFYDPCIQISMQVSEDVTVEAVMTALSESYQRYPDLRPIFHQANVEASMCQDGLVFAELTAARLDQFCETLLENPQVYFGGEVR